MAKKKTADRLVVQNAAKTLMANIRFASVDDPIRTLVLTSSVPNEGKSFVSVNLAKAIATSGKRVLLVECDMRRRSLADILELHARNGLYAVLSDQVPLSAAVVSTAQQNLDFLDAEPHIPNPADILASKRFARLVAVLEREYDFVIFDTPPVGTFVDAAVLSALVDATALVVRDNFTKRAEVLNAHDQARKGWGQLDRRGAQRLRKRNERILLRLLQQRRQARENERSAGERVWPYRDARKARQPKVAQGQRSRLSG